MKLTRGKNWWQLDLTKNKFLYVGAANQEEKDTDNKDIITTIWLKSRRYEVRYLRFKANKKWALQIGGFWSSDDKGKGMTSFSYRSFTPNESDQSL